MKNMSIKLKVTLWYTVLMILVVGAVLAFMWIISGSVIETDLKQQVTSTVNAISNNISLEDEDQVDIDGNLIQNGVYMVVYQDDKAPIKGSFQGNFLSDGIEFVSGKTQTVTQNSIDFYVYDRQVTLTDEEHQLTVWVRGVAEANAVPNLMKSLFMMALFTLPFLVLIAAIGGYLISRQAFKPMDKLMVAANTISDGKDLSKRIGLESKDEIGRLAKTFDGMFARLENAFESEKQFTSDASHELRTPITVILAQTELAQKNALTLEDHQEALSTIHRQALKISQLITHLLAFTRLDQDGAKLQKSELDLSSLAEMVCDEIKASKQTSIILNTQIQPKVTMIGDQILLTRLMSNLIENAYQYSHEKGHIWVTLTQDKKDTKFSVSDVGIGISAEDQTKIFQRFYQAESARTAKTKGSMGLGLAMVQKIAQLHQGQIDVKSTLGKGSTFTFIIKNK